MLRSLDPALTVSCCGRVDLKKRKKKRGEETDNEEEGEDRNNEEVMRGRRAEAGRWGQVRRIREERERKAHKRLTMRPP